MSAVATPVRGGGPRAIRARARPTPGLGVRLAAFGALCTFGVAHWGGLVAAPPTSKLALVAAIATAGGALLAATRRIPEPGRIAPTARIAVTLGTFALALMAVGLEARLLLPGNWNELGEGLDQGLAGLRTIEWPYDGADPWVRQTLLLGAPALAALAAALAFWPARRGGGALRVLALAALLMLYGVPITERDFGAELVRGAALTVLVAAWLWAPRARGREAGVAALVVTVAAFGAIPVAAALDRGSPWVDYRSWNWFGAVGGTAFDWGHSYGPIDWSREGTTLLRVQAERPLYWKVETLDRFDGFRWARSGVTNGVPTSAELPFSFNAAWEEEATFTVRNLRSDLVVVTGTPFRVEGLGATQIAADGTTASVDGQLREGDIYTVRAYVPNPSARELRGAPEAWPGYFRRYLTIELPRPEETNLDPVPRAPGERARSQVTPPLWGERPGGFDVYDDVLRRSPYSGAYALARRLAADAATPYEAVRNIERHLLAEYAYDEQPPSRDFPLEAFLFEDRIGYCQQFSGAMALMLRMVGIPARVVGGFAPGSFNRETGEFRVRDLDAHSWVEVYFTGLGWVQFDPTPAAAPAESRSAPDLAASAATGSTDPGRGEGVAAQRSEDAAARPEAAEDGGGASALAIVGALTAAAGVLVLGMWLAALVQRLRAGGRTERPLEELARALRRLGYGVPPQTTLLALERRLGRVAGPGSAEYVRALRDHRYGANGAVLPDGRQRKRLRRELVRRRGLAGRVRGWLAIPPFRRA